MTSVVAHGSLYGPDDLDAHDAIPVPPPTPCGDCGEALQGTVTRDIALTNAFWNAPSYTQRQLTPTTNVTTTDLSATITTVPNSSTDHFVGSSDALRGGSASIALRMAPLSRDSGIVRLIALCHINEFDGGDDASSGVVTRTSIGLGTATNGIFVVGEHIDSTYPYTPTTAKYLYDDSAFPSGDTYDGDTAPSDLNGFDCHLIIESGPDGGRMKLWPVGDGEPVDWVATATPSESLVRAVSLVANHELQQDPGWYPSNPERQQQFNLPEYVSSIEDIAIQYTINALTPSEWVVPSGPYVQDSLFIRVTSLPEIDGLIATPDIAMGTGNGFFQYKQYPDRVKYGIVDMPIAPYTEGTVDICTADVQESGAVTGPGTSGHDTPLDAYANILASLGPMAGPTLVRLTVGEFATGPALAPKASVNTLTDPAYGITQVCSANAAPFPADPTDPDDFEISFSGTKQYAAWIRLVVTEEDLYTFDTIGSDVMNTLLFLYDETPTSSSSFVDFDDDSYNYQSILRTRTMSPGTYWLCTQPVDGAAWWTFEGDIQIRVTRGSPVPLNTAIGYADDGDFNDYNFTDTDFSDGNDILLPGDYYVTLPDPGTATNRYIYAQNQDLSDYDPDLTLSFRYEVIVPLTETPGCGETPPEAHHLMSYGPIAAAEACDGIRTTFSLPAYPPGGYVVGTLRAYVDAVSQPATETDPDLGTFTLDWAPSTGDVVTAVWVVP